MEKRESLILPIFFLALALFTPATKANPAVLQSREGGSAYRWYFNNALMEGEYNSSLRPSETGVYTSFYIKDGQEYRQAVYYNATTGKQVMLYVIGDSTASSYGTSDFPRTGWAQVFQGFFNPDSVLVVNRAMSGRSSRSFYYDPGGWPAVSKLLAEGDYLFIQFGHNDSKSDTARHTDPYTTYKEFLRKYIDFARGVGAVPVLLTPIERNYWSGDKVSGSHGDYPAAMRQLASEENIPMIDLTMKSIALYEAYGKEFTTNEFFLNLPDSTYQYYKDGNSDNTHLQVRGAYEISKLVYRSIQQQNMVMEFAKLNRGSLEAGYIGTSVRAFNMGRISGDQVVPLDSTASMKAYASRGYLFDHFTVGGEDYPGESIDIQISDSLQSITAWFSLAYNVRITVVPAGKSDFAGNGTYREGDTVTVISDPDPGYRFDSWAMNDNVVSTEPEYSFVMGNTDVNLVIRLTDITSTGNERTGQPVLRYDAQSKILEVEAYVPVYWIRVIDMSGREVLSKSGSADAIHLDMSTTQNGIYLIRMETGEGIFTRKLLKH